MEYIFLIILIGGFITLYFKRPEQNNENSKSEEQQNKIPELRLNDNNINSELQKYSLNLDGYNKEVDRISVAKKDIEIRIKQINDKKRRTVQSTRIFKSPTRNY